MIPKVIGFPFLVSITLLIYEFCGEFIFFVFPLNWCISKIILFNTLIFSSALLSGSLGEGWGAEDASHQREHYFPHPVLRFFFSWAAVISGSRRFACQHTKPILEWGSGRAVMQKSAVWMPVGPAKKVFRLKGITIDFLSAGFGIESVQV